MTVSSASNSVGTRKCSRSASVSKPRTASGCDACRMVIFIVGASWKRMYGAEPSLRHIREVLMVTGAHRIDGGLQPVQMSGDALDRTIRIVGGDRLHDGGMFGYHPSHAAGFRQGQPPAAVDLHLDLLDDRPESGIPGNFRQQGMERLVGLVKALVISGSQHAALKLEVGIERPDVQRAGAHRG